MKIVKLCILALSVCFASFSATYAQTADEIAQKHITAVGGADAWKKVNTIKLMGSANSGGMEIPITLTILQGKGMRIEYTVNGMTGYSIITDKAGWNYNPFAGQTKAEALPEDIVKKSQDGLDICGPLIDYQKKGNKLTYLGKDDVEGTECHKLKITFPSGKEQTVYIDASNYYEIRSVDKIKANDKEVEQTSNYGNFQKLPEGIVYPMSVDFGGGGPMAVKTIEINKPVDESIFKPADVKEPEAKK